MQHHQSENVGCARTQGHADTDLACSFRYRIRHDTVNPDRGQSRCNRPEDAQQQNVQPDILHLPIKVLFNSADFSGRPTGIYLRCSLPHARRDAHGVTAGSQHEVHRSAHSVAGAHPARRLLKVGYIDGRPELALLAVHTDVASHADDFTQRLIGDVIQPDLFANGAFVRPESFGHGLVDDHHEGRGGCVAIAEIAALEDRRSQH
jgi:hypothetical protein